MPITSGSNVARTAFRYSSRHLSLIYSWHCQNCSHAVSSVCLTALNENLIGWKQLIITTTLLNISKRELLFVIWNHIELINKCFKLLSSTPVEYEINDPGTIKWSWRVSYMMYWVHECMWQEMHIRRTAKICFHKIILQKIGYCNEFATWWIPILKPKYTSDLCKYRWA